MDSTLNSSRMDWEFRQYSLTRRLLLLQARTRTICTFTGLSRHRVIKLRRRWGFDDEVRRRGPSHNSLIALFRSPSIRDEAASLAVLSELFGAVDYCKRWRKPFDSLPMGEILCDVLEFYRAFVPVSRFEFDRFVLLVKGLTTTNLITRGNCGACGAIIVIDPLSVREDQCALCAPRNTTSDDRYVSPAAYKRSKQA